MSSAIASRLLTLPRWTISGMRRTCNGPSQNWFGHVPLGHPDSPVNEPDGFRADPNPQKVNLGVGVYTDDSGGPVVFDSIRKAELQVLEDSHDEDRFSIRPGGLPRLCIESQRLVFGEPRDNIATIQGISGTGSLQIAVQFLKTQGLGHACISDPTWRNHAPILRSAEMTISSYRYLKPGTVDFDFEATLESLKHQPPGTVIVIQPSAHNPSGAHPENKGHVPLFDITYQGLASGSFEKDAEAIRICDRAGHRSVVCQSYAKNMGLYGERVGTISICCSSHTEAQKVTRQLEAIASALYGSPPVHGALIAQAILTNAELKALWTRDVKHAANRMRSNRESLLEHLSKSSHDWSHFVKHSGMFSMTGLSLPQINELASDHSVYMPTDGRISVAALNSRNIPYVAESILSVTG